MDNETDELLEELRRIDDAHRWHRGLIDVLDRLESPPVEQPPPKLGIDLAAKATDIRRLVMKFGIRSCIANSWDPDDLLSDVYLKIARSNVGAHPYDPRRVSLGSYVVLVLRSVITNRWRRETQRGQKLRTIAVDSPSVHIQLGYVPQFDGEIDAIEKLRSLMERRGSIGAAIIDAGGSAAEARRWLGGDSHTFVRARREMIDGLRA